MWDIYSRRNNVMRINHNIAALNTYRQLNSANGAQGKSMEKLSSGLRINKAGDDAAGLAISEKMRGQIRGLDMASKNAQDGVSMVQTAEGALNETHDILQRMRELAVQAGNDTNTSGDRGEIQKEINQLTSEINRIGNTTEFNTQKLINGDKAAVTSTSTSTPASTAAAATLTGGAAGTPGTPATQASYTITASAVNAAAGTSMGLDFDGDGTDDVTVTEGSDYTGDGTAATAATALATALAGNADWDVTDNGDGTLTLAAKAGQAADGTAGNNLTASGDTSRTQDSAGAAAVAPTAATAATGSFTISNATEGEKLTIGNKSVAFYDSTSGTYADANAAKTALGVDAVVDINGLATDIQVADAVRTAFSGLSGADTTLDAAGSATINVTAVTAGTAGNSIATSVAGVTTTTTTGGVTLQIGANQSQSLTLDLGDMRAANLGITGTGAGYTGTATVTDGTNNATVENALDVSTAANASAAITKIQTAIDSVSAERSKLGAYTNRLEHTINNLGTSSENLTAAESRVRDVDMAKEMMTQTKNSILSQAAQAMLAQSNQLPQGVLQLLR
jgi:flagellin